MRQGGCRWQAPGAPVGLRGDAKEVAMLLRPFVVFAVVLSLLPAARGGDAKDGDTIQGTWLPSTAELGGKPFPDEVRKTIKLVVKDDKYTVTVGEGVDQGT